MATRIIVSQQRSKVKSVNVVGATGSGASIDTLVELKDVDATSVDNNETVVYDDASGKFIVKTLPVVDGGSY